MSKNMNKTKLLDAIEQERENAQSICHAHGANSRECAAAWDAVEELQTEAAHQFQLRSQSSTAHEKAIRIQEILQLGAIGSEAAINTLCQILENDSEPEIRAAAAQAIGMIAAAAS
jgi:HEAT repeat protein